VNVVIVNKSAKTKTFFIVMTSLTDCDDVGDD